MYIRDKIILKYLFNLCHMNLIKAFTLFVFSFPVSIVTCHVKMIKVLFYVDYWISRIKTVPSLELVTEAPFVRKQYFYNILAVPTTSFTWN